KLFRKHEGPRTHAWDRRPGCRQRAHPPRPRRGEAHLDGSLLRRILGRHVRGRVPGTRRSAVARGAGGVLVMPDEGEGFFQEIRKGLPKERQAEYDEFLKSYLDFGSVFSRSEAELASMNRRLGEFFFAATARRGHARPPKP